MATKFANIKAPVKKDYGRVEDGTYGARIVQLIMLGSQIQTDWQSGEMKEDDDGNVIYKEEIWITFEFPTERIVYTDDEAVEHDRPRWQSKTYTLSMHEKANFRKMLDAIAPDGEGLADLVGQPGTITVGSTSGGKAKITSAVAPMKGMTVADLENDPVIYDLDEPDEEIFDGLPDFLQEKIKNRQIVEDASDTVPDEPSTGEDPFAE